MLKNYCLVAIRNLFKYKTFSLINIAGLGLGLACCILILLYTQHELSYDSYHTHAQHIYRLAMNTEQNTYGRGNSGIAKIPGPWGPTALRALPEVKQMARLQFYGAPLISNETVQFYESSGFYADPSLFDLFTIPFIQGNPNTALAEPNSVVLTEQLATKYFGNKNPLGQTLIFDNTDAFQITGIVKDVPSNSHFAFSFLVSLSTDKSGLAEDWQRNQFYTYLLLHEGALPATIETKFADFLAQNTGVETAPARIPFLQPLTDIHLHSDLFRELQANSSITYVYALSAIALFILLIACINFMNLTTARGANRAKEVGIRKSAGAQRSELIAQFLGESILLCLIATLVAVALVDLLLPAFNTLSGKQLTTDFLYNPLFASQLLFLSLLVGCLAGSYPAFFLSAFQAQQVLKGNTPETGNTPLRKILVVFQFAISALLITATCVVGNQVDYIRTKKLGFNKDQLLILPIKTNTLRKQYETFKAEIVQHPNILAISASANMPGGSDYGMPSVPQDLPADVSWNARHLVVDHDFLQTYQVQFSQGRNFSKDIASDAGAYIINKAAVKKLGWHDPLSKTIAMPVIGREPGPVIGVIEDFHFRSFRQAIAPLMVYIQPSNWYSRFSIRIRPENLSETLAFLKEKWHAFEPNHPFTYYFFDTHFNQIHRTDQQTGKILASFSLLAIAIACLGLFGLTAFATQQRAKEIGIRKILGASISHIILLLSGKFLKLTLLANIIAAPAAYYFSSTWLNAFAYRITLGPAVFMLTALLTLFIAALTVGGHAYKTARANPINALRSE